MHRENDEMSRTTDTTDRAVRKRSRLKELIGNLERLRAEILVITAPTETTPTSPFGNAGASVSSVAVDRNPAVFAWDLLHNSSKVKDVAGLTAYLAEIGMDSAEDLSVCDKEITARLRSFLKEVPQKHFEDAMAKLIS